MTLKEEIDELKEEVELMGNQQEGVMEIGAALVGHEMELGQTIKDIKKVAPLVKTLLDVNGDGDVNGDDLELVLGNLKEKGGIRWILSVIIAFAVKMLWMIIGDWVGGRPIDLMGYFSDIDWVMYIFAFLIILSPIVDQLNIKNRLQEKLIGKLGAQVNKLENEIKDMESAHTHLVRDVQSTHDLELKSIDFEHRIELATRDAIIQKEA